MSQRPVRAHGQLRQSQVLTTFGPGAMVDLPNHAVIVGGLEHWKAFRPDFRRTTCGKTTGHPAAHKLETASASNRPSGSKCSQNCITGWQFPEWFVAQFEVPWGDVFRSRPLLNRLALVMVDTWTETEGSVLSYPSVLSSMREWSYQRLRLARLRSSRAVVL